MDRAAVQRWLDAYIGAWRSNDSDAIGALFSADAEYRYYPWDEPVRGRDAIVASWTSSPDDPATWKASYAPWAVGDDRAVAVGISRYDDADGKRDYHNAFLLEFDADGRCRSFTEYYVERKRD